MNLDKELLEVMLELNHEYSIKTYYKEAIAGGEEAIKLAKQLNDTVSLATSYLSLAYIHFHVDKNVESLEWTNKALFLYKTINDEVGLINTYIQLSKLQKDVDVKMDFLLKAATYLNQSKVENYQRQYESC